MCLKLVYIGVVLQLASGNANTASSGRNQNQFNYKIVDIKHSGIPKYVSEKSHRLHGEVSSVISTESVVPSNTVKLSSRASSVPRSKRQFESSGWRWGGSDNRGRDTDSFVFGGDTIGATSQSPLGSTAIPGMGTRRPPCEENCQGTPQYNPVCGSDDVTYFSMWRITCAQKCGRHIGVVLQLASGNANTASSGRNQNQFNYKIVDIKHSGIPKYVSEKSHRLHGEVSSVISTESVVPSNTVKLSSRASSVPRSKRQFESSGWRWGGSDNRGRDTDSFVFGGDTIGATSQSPLGSTAIPGMGTRRPPCEENCQGTPQYNPVCGSDDVTYFSMWRITCAQKCGRRVAIKHLGACSKIPPRG